MGKLSKINIILIIVTVLSIGITIGILIKYNQVQNLKSENEAIEETDSYENSPMGNVEPIEESTSYENTPMGAVEPIKEFDPSISPFDESIDLATTGEFVKSLLQENFLYKINQSNSGTIYKPFGDKIRNFPSAIDYSQIGSGKALPPEVQEVLDNSARFDYELIHNVINNFQLVKCEKGISRTSRIMYECSFILPNLDGTGLEDQVVNRGPNNFTVNIMELPIGYEVGKLN